MKAPILCILGTFLLAGCLDKAKADYDKCVEMDKGYDVKGAAAACSAAVAADPNSPSGQAAAKKLNDLQLVSQKLTDEARDKAAREAQVHKEEPVTVLPTATATQAPVADPLADAGVKEVLAQAHALYIAGDTEQAQALIDPYIPSDGKPSPEAIRAAKEICKGKHDSLCTMLKRKLR